MISRIESVFFALPLLLPLSECAHHLVTCLQDFSQVLG